MGSLENMKVFETFPAYLEILYFQLSDCFHSYANSFS